MTVVKDCSAHRLAKHIRSLQPPDDVLFFESLLLVEDSRRETPEISVEVSRDINFHSVFFCYYLIVLSISASMYLNLMQMVSAFRTVIRSTYLRVMVY